MLGSELPAPAHDHLHYQMMSRAYKALPATEQLWDLFDYKPLTGELVWKNHPRYRTLKGRKAGSQYTNGYTTIELKLQGKRVRFTAQRVIWKWVTGTDPGEFNVDHKDTNKSNNRFWNYRLATTKQNKENYLYRNWVMTPAGKYRVMMGPSNTNRYVGTFDTQAEAEAAVKKASIELHGAFSPYTEE